jgi:regulatory protein
LKVITELKQVGTSEKYKVFVNEEFVFFASLEVLYKMCIKQGQQVDEDILDNLKFESDKILAFSIALDLSLRGLKTKKQINDYLYKKGYDKQVQEHVIEKLEGYGYINDLEYAERYVEQLKLTKGKNLIKQQLFQKGISQSLIDQVTKNLNQEENVLNVAAKYLKNKEKSQENKQKLYRHLLSRGFLYGEVSSAVKKMFNGEVDDWD